MYLNAIQLKRRCGQEQNWIFYVKCLHGTTVKYKHTVKKKERKTSTTLTSQKFALHLSFLQQFNIISPLLLFSLFCWWLQFKCMAALFKNIFTVYNFVLCIEVFAHWLNMLTTGIWGNKTAVGINSGAKQNWAELSVRFKKKIWTNFINWKICMRFHFKPNSRLIATE